MVNMHKNDNQNSEIPRRAFMKQAAATTAFSIMSAKTALGAAANSKVTAGIIGQGGRGTMISRMVQAHGGYQITALADYFPDVVAAAGEQFSVDKAQCYSGLMGYERLLESGVDSVFLETPPYCFPEHTEAAVKAGCHVYIAKPLGCDVPGCISIHESGKRATADSKVFLVDFQTRTDPFYIEGIKRIQAGEYGAIALLSSEYDDEAFADPPLTATIESRLRHLIWVNDVALGGGSLVNAGIHAVDVALWIADETPVSAMGMSRIGRADPHGDSHDVFSLSYAFSDGLILNHRGEHLKNRYGFKCECFAFCQDGRLETGYSGKVEISGISTGYKGGKVDNLYPRGAERNIDTFHKSIVNRDYSNPTLEPGVNSTLATILGREAAERKTLVTWDQMLKENRRIEPNLKGLKA